MEKMKRHSNLNEDLENQFTFSNDNNPNDAQASHEHATNSKKHKPKNNSSGIRSCISLSFAAIRGAGNNNNNKKLLW